MKPLIRVALAALGLTLGPAAFAAGNVTADLKAQNSSGETGTVMLTPRGDKTEVTIKLSGAPAGVQQPAHVHQGTCAKLDPKPKYPLQNVTDGGSTTTLPVKLAALTDGKHAVNVHKSADDLKTYVACADLKPMK